MDGIVTEDVIVQTVEMGVGGGDKESYVCGYCSHEFQVGVYKLESYIKWIFILSGLRIFMYNVVV